MLRADAPGRTGRASALLRSARPRQWTKNLLVFAVPAAAGALDDVDVVLRTLLAFVAFCFVSSGAYLLNDAADVEADRLHPLKRRRPIAAGELSVRAAKSWGTAAIVAGLGVSLLAAPALLGLVGAYVLLTLLYTRWLKHQPVFDIAAVAAGFFLRAVAGGAASDIFISRWFLIVAGGGSLFLIVGKRYAELLAGGEDMGRRRPALAHYSRDYLESMLSTTAAITVVAYCLWAFDEGVGRTHSLWTEVSVVPFVLGIMRYGLLLAQGHGEEPEEILLGDRVLQAIGALWFLALGIGAVV